MYLKSLFVLFMGTWSLMASEADDRFTKVRDLFRFPVIGLTLGDTVKEALHRQFFLQNSAPSGESFYSHLGIGDGFGPSTRCVIISDAAQERIIGMTVVAEYQDRVTMTSLGKLRSSLEGALNVTIPLDGTPVTVDHLVITWAIVPALFLGGTCPALSVIDLQGRAMTRAEQPAPPAVVPVSPVKP